MYIKNKEEQDDIGMIIPKAFIFDLDGVIVDTAKYHYLAWKSLAEKLGIVIDEEFNENLKGISRMESLEKILSLDQKYLNISDEEKQKLANKKNEEYKKLITQIKQTDVLPGIKEFLSELKIQNIKTAIASASKNAFDVIEYLDIKESFDYIADASTIRNTKPDPEVFLDCCINLGVYPGMCIGIEDAKAGIQAINSAGMFSIGIGDKEVLKDSDIVFESTIELDFIKIIKLFEENLKK